LRHACLCARVCDDYKGKDTVILDLSPVTPIVDYFVITTGTSRRQMHAIAEETDRVLKAEGSARRGLEGYERSDWILQDYGDVVLHVMSDEARRTYDLERLWADAPRVDWRAQLGLGIEQPAASDTDRAAGQD
jgi:ribosome-associated protein